MSGIDLSDKARLDVKANRQVVGSVLDSYLCWICASYRLYGYSQHI
jgi:hypothetical protein